MAKENIKYHEALIVVLNAKPQIKHVWFDEEDFPARWYFFDQKGRDRIVKTRESILGIPEVKEASKKEASKTSPKVSEGPKTFDTDGTSNSGNLEWVKEQIASMTDADQVKQFADPEDTRSGLKDAIEARLLELQNS